MLSSVLRSGANCPTRLGIALLLSSELFLLLALAELPGIVEIANIGISRAISPTSVDSDRGLQVEHMCVQCMAAHCTLHAAHTAHTAHCTYTEHCTRHSALRMYIPHVCDRACTPRVPVTAPASACGKLKHEHRIAHRTCQVESDLQWDDLVGNL